MSALDEFMADPEPDCDEPPAAPDGADQANRMLRRLGLLIEERDEVNRLASIEQARLDEWWEHENNRLNKRIDHLTASLTLYHEARLGEDSKAKTIRLPAGDLTARSRPDRFEFNADEFLPWAQENAPELVRRRPAPDPEIDKRTAAQVLSVKGAAVVYSGGEIPPGVRVVPGGVDFTPKPTRKDDQ